MNADVYEFKCIKIICKKNRKYLERSKFVQVSIFFNHLFNLLINIQNTK